MNSRRRLDRPFAKCSAERTLGNGRSRAGWCCWRRRPHARAARRSTARAPRRRATRGHSATRTPVCRHGASQSPRSACRVPVARAARRPPLVRACRTCRAPESRPRPRTWRQRHSLASTAQGRGAILFARPRLAARSSWTMVEQVSTMIEHAVEPSLTNEQRDRERTAPACCRATREAKARWHGRPSAIMVVDIVAMTSVGTRSSPLSAPVSFCSVPKAIRRRAALQVSPICPPKRTALSPTTPPPERLRDPARALRRAVRANDEARRRINRPAPQKSAPPLRG